MLLVRAASASGAQRFTEGDSRRNIPHTNTVTVIGIFFLFGNRHILLEIKICRLLLPIIIREIIPIIYNLCLLLPIINIVMTVCCIKRKSSRFSFHCSFH